MSLISKPICLLMSPYLPTGNRKTLSHPGRHRKPTGVGCQCNGRRPSRRQAPQGREGGDPGGEAHLPVAADHTAPSSRCGADEGQMGGGGGDATSIPSREWKGTWLRGLRGARFPCTKSVSTRHGHCRHPAPRSREVASLEGVMPRSLWSEQEDLRQARPSLLHHRQCADGLRTHGRQPPFPPLVVYRGKQTLIFLPVGPQARCVFSG